MGFDSPWKVAALIGGVAALRLAWGLWKQAPGRASFLELCDQVLIALVLVFFLIRPFVVQAFYIPSPSMEPTLRRNDRILVNKFIYRLSSPRRGDVIVFRAPPEAAHSLQEVDFIKRLIGLPGDRIRVVGDDGVYVNGRKLSERYAAELPNSDWPPPPEELEYSGFPDRDCIVNGELVVPEGKLFVMGDNRNASNDSRSWGALPKRNVLGKAMVIFLPPTRLTFITDNRVYATASSPAEGTAAASHGRERGAGRED
jgi:signal peptidase I